MPIVTDNVLVDPTLGTGAVKITPAHDPEDHACAERVLRRQTNVEDLPLNWEVFDESGNIVQIICSDCSSDTFEDQPRKTKCRSCQPQYLQGFVPNEQRTACEKPPYTTIADCKQLATHTNTGPSTSVIKV